MIAALPDRHALDELVRSPGTLAVGFGDPANEASNAFLTAFEAVAERVPEIAFRRAVMPPAEPIAQLFGIRALPALVLFRDGVGLFAGPATFSAAQLEALLRRALSLDMNTVQAEMQRERDAEASMATHLVCPTARRGNISR